MPADAHAQRRGTAVETDVPARLDRLPWTRFHWLVVLALGITWVLDGLEVTLAGAVAGALKASPTPHLTEAEIEASASPTWWAPCWTPSTLAG